VGPPRFHVTVTPRLGLQVEWLQIRQHVTDSKPPMLAYSPDLEASPPSLTGSQLANVKGHVMPSTGEAEGNEGPHRGQYRQRGDCTMDALLALGLIRLGHRRRAEEIIGSECGMGCLR
jgi:hypothetical protein